MVITIIAYSVAFGYIILIIRFSNLAPSCSCLSGIFMLAFVLSEIGLLITLIVIYVNTLNSFQAVNLEVLQYAVDYGCTDGPLQRVLKFIVADF